MCITEIRTPKGTTWKNKSYSRQDPKVQRATSTICAIITGQFAINELLGIEMEHFESCE